MEPKGNSGAEYNAGQYEANPSFEQGVDTPSPVIEHYSERHEVEGPAPSTPAASTVIDPVTLPTPVPLQSDDNSTTQTTDDNPATAADDDLIEKEWVDKAKKIIEQTRDDPHRREIEVSKLQSDYLKKRYGRDVGNAA